MIDGEEGLKGCAGILFSIFFAALLWVAIALLALAFSIHWMRK